MSSVVRRVIASHVTHLFSAPQDPAEDVGRRTRKRRTSAADGDDPVDDDDEEAPKKRKRGRRAGAGAGGDWSLVDNIATEIELEQEDEYVGVSAGDLDRRLELEEHKRLDSVLGAEDEEESEASEDDAPEQDDDRPMSRAERNRLEDLRIYKKLTSRMPAIDGSTTMRSSRRARKSTVNYGINAVLDCITEPLYGPNDWIWNRDAAQTVVDEDARTKQTILSMTVPNSRDIPPPRGMRTKYPMPVSIQAVRFKRWMLKPTPKLYTTNVVSTFDLGSQTHLFYIINRLPGVCFNPRCFAAAKLRSTEGTDLIFSGGRVVCAGANSVQKSRIAAVQCTMALTRAGIQAEVSKFTVQNVVSTADAGFQIDLFELANAYPINAHFDPECFPGLMFRLTTSQLVFIVFKSGKCIITGLPYRERSLIAWRFFHSYVLWEFEMKSGVAHETEADYRRRWRQQTSMIQSMCESVRDITTVHLASLLDREGDPQPPEDIFAGRSHFDQLVDMTRRIGHSYDNEGAKPLDLESWVAQQPALAPVSKG